MDLQHQALIVNGIREKMKKNLGEKIFVKVDLGRSRIHKNYGTLVQTHPSVFIVELEHGRGRVANQSFQYADILTGKVEIFQNDKPMFGPFNIVPDAPLVEPSKTPRKKKRLRPSKPIEQRIRLNSSQVAMLVDRIKAESEASKKDNGKEIVLELSKNFSDKKIKKAREQEEAKKAQEDNQ